MLKRKIKNQSRREGQLSQKKQQSFHYSARRTESDRQFDRQEVMDEPEKRPKKQAKEKWQLRIRRFGLLAVVLLLLWINFLPGSVTVMNPQALDADPNDVRTFAQNEAKKSLLNKSKLTLKRDDLSRAIKDHYVGFSDVDVSSDLFGKNIVLDITSSRPAVLLSTGSNIYIVGQDGVALAEANKKKASFDSSSVPLVQDQSAISIEVGKQALSTEQVTFIEEVAYQLETGGLPIATMILLPGGGELQVRFGKVNYYGKFSMYEDARKSSGTFLAMKAESDKSGPKPQEYIDVRIPERAYIK